MLAMRICCSCPAHTESRERFAARALSYREAHRQGNHIFRNCSRFWRGRWSDGGGTGQAPEKTTPLHFWFDLLLQAPPIDEPPAKRTRIDDDDKDPQLADPSPAGVTASSDGPAPFSFTVPSLEQPTSELQQPESLPRLLFLPTSLLTNILVLN